MQNADPTVTTGFGREWSTFTQSEQSLERAERERLFAEYFRIFPWPELPANAEGLDAGCGSGRWAFLVAPRVGRLHVLDASREALEVAKANLAGQGNVTFHYASVSDIPLADHSLDFAYSRILALLFLQLVMLALILVPFGLLLADANPRSPAMPAGRPKTSTQPSTRACRCRFHANWIWPSVNNAALSATCRRWSGAGSCSSAIRNWREANRVIYTPRGQFEVSMTSRERKRSTRV